MEQNFWTFFILSLLSMLLWLIQHAAVPSLLGAGKDHGPLLRSPRWLASFWPWSGFCPAPSPGLRDVFASRSKATRPEVCRLHAGSNATPTMGGLFIIAGVLGSVLLMGNLSNRYLLLGLVGNSGIGFSWRN